MMASSTDTAATPKFDRERHIRYFTSCLKSLPSPYDRMDTNRLTLCHFCVHALDIMGYLDEEEHPYCLTEEDAATQRIVPVFDKKQIIDWIYSLQLESGGFVGGTFMGDTTTNNNNNNHHHHAHIAMTYTALCTLAALGDDLSRLYHPGTIDSLRGLQNDQTGAFQCIAVGSEEDLRFLYCACVISHLLGDWSAIDQDKAVEYIQSCRSYDGGAFALLPNQEGHGGSTFCAVAALTLMNRMDVLNDCNGSRMELIKWCVSRQVAGMQGRPNKAQDTCYSYWIGGTLQLLLAADDDNIQNADLLDNGQLRHFVMTCQTNLGGFSKAIGAYPDVLHAFYSMAWLSMSTTADNDDDGNKNGDDLNLKKLCVTIGICKDRLSVFDCEREVP